jgi:hypothetical protein
MTLKPLLVAGCLLLDVGGWGLGAARLRACGALAGSGLLAMLVLSSACAPAPQTGNTPKAGTAMSRSIVDPYLRIQAALANDSVDGVRQNAGEVATAATALGAPAMKIDTTAVQLAATTELADARVKFGMLSEAIDTYMTGLHLTPPEGIKVAVCPMVNKPWMQEGDAIKNPYYGSEMLTCGNFR